MASIEGTLTTAQDYFLGESTVEYIVPSRGNNRSSNSSSCSSKRLFWNFYDSLFRELFSSHVRDDGRY